MLTQFIAFTTGILAGTFTGLTPGIHINLISVMVFLLYLNKILPLSQNQFIIFIVSMSITHTFLDFIPSILLGAPDEDSFLSILPGHRLLLKGHGYAAIIYTLYGSLFSILIVFSIIPFFIFYLPFIYRYIEKIMFLVLILVSVYLIVNEGKKKILLSIFIFVISGFVGISSLNLGIKEPFLPLFTGMFGMSGLIISLTNKTTLPSQKVPPLNKIKLSKRSFLKGITASALIAPLTSFLPGLGSSQAAVIGKELADIEKENEFLFLIGAINTIVMALSFVTLFSIGKTRTGSASVISFLNPNLNFIQLKIILIIIVITSIIAFLIGIFLSKFICKNLRKLAYEKLSTCIIVVLIIIVTLFSDFTIKGRIISLIILAVSTALGLTAILLRVRRIHLMGSILIPTILTYI